MLRIKVVFIFFVVILQINLLHASQRGRFYATQKNFSKPMMYVRTSIKKLSVDSSQRVWKRSLRDESIFPNSLMALDEVTQQLEKMDITSLESLTRIDSVVSLVTLLSSSKAIRNKLLLQDRIVNRVSQSM